MTKNRLTEEKAKALANKIGLLYWKALKWGLRINPKAFVYAEAVFSKKYGFYEWKNGVVNYGGWDNFTLNKIVTMWRVAGSRNSEKFRFQISNEVLARRGESISFLRHYYEGLRWLSRWRPDLEHFPRKTLAAIGRVSPEARHALVANITRGERVRQVRIRDLNWERVKTIQRLRIEGTERSLLIRAAALPTVPAAELLGFTNWHGLDHPIRQDKIGIICPTYPNLRMEVATRIAMGTSPVAISNNLLTRKEAHQWLLAGGPAMIEPNVIRESVIRWLVRSLPLGDYLPRNPVVARWLVHVYTRGGWGSLVRVRRFPGNRTVSYFSILDEIIPEDLDRGISTGVERAFERAFGRARVSQGEEEEDHTVLCKNPFQQLPKWIRLLTTPAELVEEGRFMDHCVGGYASSVEEGECLILSIASTHGRSTVEIRWEEDGWWVSQHKGYHNTPPPPRHEALLEAWLRRENQILQREVS